MCGALLKSESGHVPLSDFSPVSLLWVVVAQGVEWGSEVERVGTSLSQ